jgi:SAM-dependent methyltransferase
MAKSHENAIITKATRETWGAAQEFEKGFARSILEDGDDWNGWWRDQFDGYEALRGKDLRRVLEVGCGPHTNLRIILPLIDAKEVFLEDPLLGTYLVLETPLDLSSRIRNRSPRRAFVWEMLRDPGYRAHFSTAPLEELPFRDALVDLVVCVNVLDHVFDFECCMAEMARVLRPGGFLVLGQDLSNEEDYELAPDSWEDVGHPIKLDERTLDGQLMAFDPILRKVLPREAGRNPRAHYGTYLGILRKR